MGRSTWNVFSHHVVWDMRAALFAANAWLFGRTSVYFKVWHVHRRTPLLVGFGLEAAFIWLAENIGIFTCVWLYPKQAAAWSLVSWQTFGSWTLPMIVSYMLVMLVSRPRTVRRSAPGTAPMERLS